MRAIGEAIMNRLEISKALQKELQTRRNLLPPEPWEEIARSNTQAFTSWISSRMQSGAKNQPGVVVHARKPNWGYRPVPIVGATERVAYRALTDYILDGITIRTRSTQEYISFISGPITEGLFSQGPVATIGNAKYEYVAETDIAAYYQYIDHEKLRQELHLQTSKFDEVDILIELLGEIQGATFGLPQLLDSSDDLSEVYLDILERDLIRRGFDIWRYNDDIKIGAKNFAQAIDSIATTNASAKDLGLVLNEEKTKVVKFINYLFWHNVNVDDEDAHIDPREIDLSPPDYPNLDEDEILEVAYATFRKIIEPDSTPSVASSAIDLRKLTVDEYRELRKALAAFVKHGDPFGLNKLLNILIYAPALTPRSCEYLIATSGSSPTEIAKIWDTLVTIHNDELGEWQKAWLAYTAREARLLHLKGESQRISWMVDIFKNAGSEYLRAEAALCLATTGKVDVGDLDSALRVRPAPLSPWYLVGLKNLGSSNPQRLTAIAKSSPLFNIILNGNAN
jgi:hypothetical protein